MTITGRTPAIAALVPLTALTILPALAARPQSQMPATPAAPAPAAAPTRVDLRALLNELKAARRQLSARRDREIKALDQAIRALSNTERSEARDAPRINGGAVLVEPSGPNGEVEAVPVSPSEHSLVFSVPRGLDGKLEVVPAQPGSPTPRTRLVQPANPAGAPPRMPISPDSLGAPTRTGQPQVPPSALVAPQTGAAVNPSRGRVKALRRALNDALYSLPQSEGTIRRQLQRALRSLPAPSGAGPSSGHSRNLLYTPQDAAALVKRPPLLTPEDHYSTIRIQGPASGR